MCAIALPCWSSLLLVFLQAGLGSPLPVTRSPSSQELQSLQDLLERLEEKFQQGELDVADDRDGDTGDNSYSDLADVEAFLSSQLKLQESLHRTEIEDQWRKLVATPKRRRFSEEVEKLKSKTEAL